MTAVGSTLRIIDSDLNRASNYWYALYTVDQRGVLAQVDPDGLWDVVFIDKEGIPHMATGVLPCRFEVTDPPLPRRPWWQFWRRRTPGGNP